jgi:hypothetical protein
MKFDELFKSVYLAEEETKDQAATETEEINTGSTVPTPEDFDDVEPMPLPEQPEQEATPEGEEKSSGSVPSATTLKDYVFQLEDFAEKLNGVEGNSLQSLVSSLDRPGTPFDGISSRTKGEIVRVAETLLSISEKLKSFIINAVKK